MMKHILETSNKNRYFYHHTTKQTMYMHPLVHFFHEKEQNAENIDFNFEMWLERITDKPGTCIHIQGIGDFELTDIRYYYRKYLFFKEKGYFNPPSVPPVRQYRRQLKASEVEHLVARCREIIFEVTKSCNLNCYYCIQGKFYDIHESHQQVNLDTAKSKLLLDYMAPYWERSESNGLIGIKFYGGEPLINIDILREVIDYSKTFSRIRDRFYYYITTNGILLDKHLDYLVSENVFLSISLDGDAKNNSYRTFKDGSPSFEKLFANLNLIKERFPRYFETNISFQSVLHDRNSITNLTDYFEKHFGKLPMMTELTQVGIPEEMKKSFDRLYASVYKNLYYGCDYPLLQRKKLNQLPKIPEVGVGGLIVHDIYNRLLTDRVGEGTDTVYRTPTGTCHPFSKKIFLTTDGRLLPCERIEHRHALGIVTDRVNLDFRSVADTFNKYFASMSKICGTCANGDFCKKCMFSCKVETGKPVCNLYTNQKDFLIHLAENISYMENHPDVHNKLVTEV